MVRTVLERDAAGVLCGFAVRGHAGQGAAGRDVVCAAVSALTQTAVLGLRRRLGLDPRVRMGGGWLECRLPAPLPAESARGAADILETMVLGLEAIAALHPRAVVVVTRPASGTGTGGATGSSASGPGLAGRGAAVSRGEGSDDR